MPTRCATRSSPPIRWAESDHGPRAGLTALAADGLAVDAEGVHHLRGGAVVLGALDAVTDVVDDSAVAVLEPRPTLPALDAHCPVVALCADNWRMPRSGPAEFVQAIVVDAEMMGDLVDHGDRHLIDDVLVAVADVEHRVPVDRDGVR